MINLISRQSSLAQSVLRKKDCNSSSCVKNNNLSPLKSDTISFSGVRKVSFSELSNANFPSNFYLTQPSVAEKLSNFTGAEIMQKLPMAVGDLMAQRMQFLGSFCGFSEKMKCGAHSYGLRDDMPKFFKIHEVGMKKTGADKNERKFELDWTEQYNALNKILNKDEKLNKEEQSQLMQTLVDFNLVKK